FLGHDHTGAPLGIEESILERRLEVVGGPFAGALKMTHGIENALSIRTGRQGQCIDQSVKPMPLFPQVRLSVCAPVLGPFGQVLLAGCNNTLQATGTYEYFIGLDGESIDIWCVAPGPREVTQDLDELREIHPPVAVPRLEIGPRLRLDTAEESNQHGDEIIEAAGAGLG